jgi:hypothetical protein
VHDRLRGGQTFSAHFPQRPRSSVREWPILEIGDCFRSGSVSRTIEYANHLYVIPDKLKNRNVA